MKVMVNISIWVQLISVSISGGGIGQSCPLKAAKFQILVWLAISELWFDQSPKVIWDDNISETRSDKKGNVRVNFKYIWCKGKLSRTKWS